MTRIFKVIITFLAALSLLFSPLPSNVTLAEQEKTYEYDNYTYTLNNDGTCVITFYHEQDDHSDYPIQPHTDKLTLPGSLEGHKVTGYGPSVFYFRKCRNLLEITLPDGLESIEGNPFSDIRHRIIVSPDHPRFAVIDETLFDKVDKRIIDYNNSNASAYVVPRGIRVIGDSAFNSSNIESVTMFEGLQSIQDYAFWNCSSLASVTLPEGLQSIGDGSFGYCWELTSIVLPRSLMEMTNNPFRLSLTNIYVSPDHPRFAVIDGVLFDKVENRLISYPYGSKESAYAVPQGVRSIGKEAFFLCESLQSVIIPASVTSIDERAFVEMPLLTLTVDRDSYAESWAKENSMAYTFADALDWLNN